MTAYLMRVNVRGKKLWLLVTKDHLFKSFRTRQDILEQARAAGLQISRLVRYTGTMSPAEAAMATVDIQEGRLGR